MVKLKLVATRDNRLIRILHRYARRATTADVRLVDDPVRADAIVFVETVDWRDPSFLRVRRHGLARAHPDKTLLFNEADRNRARMPTVAMNAADVPWQIGMGTLPIHEDQNPLDPISSAPTALMSFAGSRNSRVRARILDLYARTHPAVIDTDAYDAWHTTDAERAAQRRIFERALGAGLFALCPRGDGISSLRLYEAMQAGRCPVIITDDWVEDFGVDWSFAVRVAEADCHRLEEILGAIPRREALARGVQGRRRWESAYAPERYVRTLGLACRTLLERRAPVPRRNLVDVLEDARYGLWIGARHLRARTAALGTAASARVVAADGDTLPKP